MSENVQDSYDALAELYASLFLDALDHDTNATAWLATFAELAAADAGSVADLGCGPGLVTDHLARLGLEVVGYDLSPGQIEQARHAFPDRRFHVGDLTDLAVPDATFAGIVSRYSIIHLPPEQHIDAFDEWRRVLRPGAPALVSFFGSLTRDAHGAPFDHKVTTAYELFPTVVAEQLDRVGFTDIETHTLPPPEDGRPLDQATVLARAPHG